MACTYTVGQCHPAVWLCHTLLTPHGTRWESSKNSTRRWKFERIQGVGMWLQILFSLWHAEFAHPCILSIFSSALLRNFNNRPCKLSFNFVYDFQIKEQIFICYYMIRWKNFSVCQNNWNFKSNNKNKQLVHYQGQFHKFYVIHWIMCYFNDNFTLCSIHFIISFWIKARICLFAQVSNQCLQGFYKLSL